MKHLALILLLIGFWGINYGAVLAQVSETEETVIAADLGIENSGLLPTNPFYFLKEFGRGVRRALTFNPVSKAKLELRITNEKAAEVKRVEEARPNDAEAVVTALKNYQEAQGRLRVRFEVLKETSQNPNVDRLLQDFTDKAVRHIKLFNELGQKFENSGEVVKLVSQSKDIINESAVKAAEKDEPEKFAVKIEKSLNAEKGDFKDIRSIEIIDKFQKNAPETLKKPLEKLRENFSDKLESDIKKVIQTQNVGAVQRAIEGLPGNAEHRVEILRELKVKVPINISAVLEKVSVAIENRTYRNSYRQCYDGKESREENSGCKSSKIWQEEAEKFCDGHCYEDKSKCGVNTFSISNQCEDMRPLPVVAPPAIVPGLSPTVKPQEEILCTQQYDPVCGENGKTYSNECAAKVAGVVVQYRGECRAIQKDCGPLPSIPAPPYGCKYDGPSCGEGKWNYKLVCPESTPAETFELSPAIR